MHWGKTALVWIALCFTADAAIQDTRSIREIVPKIDSETLWIFDLDNTVVMPAQTLGGEEWFDYQVEQLARRLEAEGKPKAEAKEQALKTAVAEWNRIQSVTDVVPVETDAPGAIRLAQDRGTKVMALTAREADLSEITDRQLRAIGIDLSRNLVHSKALSIRMKQATANYDNGVLYVGSKNNKGEVLIEFLKRTGLRPKRIAFVDNKLKHVENVGRALAGSNIVYLGFRHGPADAKIAAFDGELADFQYECFRRILNDSNARKMMRAMNGAAQ